MWFQIFIITYLSHFICISPQDISCNNAYECVGQTINKPSLVSGNGYKSISGSITSVIASDIMCEGAFSCNALSNMESTGWAACYGGNACYNISESAYINTPKYINCMGSNSCKYSNIKSTDPTSSDGVFCNGDASCAYSKIIGKNNVYGGASYSLYKAVIESTDTLSLGGLNVYFQGFFAGYGATVICHSGDICYINCYQNACFMTFVDCSEAMVCSISLIGDAVAPITNHSLFDDSTLDLMDNSLENDEECDEYATYDDYTEQQYNDELISITEHNICCRGSYACSNINNIEISGSIGAKIICSGSYSCFESNIINNNGAVFCDGLRSCEGRIDGRNVMNTTDNVYCLGAYCCKSRHIYHSRNITCSGVRSCEESNITTAGVGGIYNVYLLSYWSGYNTNIVCKANDECFILCGGFSSCDNTFLLCDGNCIVECDETSGCPEWNNTSSVTVIPPRIQIPTPSVTIASNPTLSPNDSAVLPNTSGSISSTPTDVHVSNSITTEMTTSESMFRFGIMFLIQFESEDRTINMSIITAIFIDEILSNFESQTIENCIGDLDGLVTNETVDNVTVICGMIKTCDEDIEHQLLNVYNASNNLEKAFINKVELFGKIYVEIDTLNMKSMECRVIDHHYDEDINKDHYYYVYVIFVIFGSVFGMILVSIIFKRSMYRKHPDEILRINNAKEVINVVPSSTMKTSRLCDIVLTTSAPIIDKRSNKNALSVQYWLQNVVKLPQYYDIFMNNGYESLQIIKEISNVTELIEIGIVSTQHQTKLLQEIAELAHDQNQRDRVVSLDGNGMMMRTQEGH